MTLLKFFLEWGEHGLGFLWVIYAGLMIWFAYQTYRTWYNSETRITDLPGGQRIEEKNQPKMSLVEIPTFWFMVALTIIAGVVHFIIEASYK